MKTQYLIASKTIDIFKQKARKLKQEKSISHTQALDEIAQQYKFNHWHHVCESYKALEATEKAVQSGLMIIMDTKQAEDFYDETGLFIEDEDAFFFCEKFMFREYIEAVDDDGIRFIDKTPKEELRQEFIETYDMDYGFFRYTGKTLPKTSGDALKLVDNCCYWLPEYIVLNGKYHDRNSYLE